MEKASGQLQPQTQVSTLRARGYVVVPRFLAGPELQVLNQAAREQLAAAAAPLEFEADLKYPGAPMARNAAGGNTVRRLLDAYGRDRSFARCATLPRLRDWMELYFGEGVSMSRVHHNCLMTKHPRYGSLTGWHRDIRYWQFEREDLVSAWFALGEEDLNNGALWFVPDSHRMTLGAERFDAAKFLRTDRQDNVNILDSAESPRLASGDAVFFHCNTLHSAGQNHSGDVKYSLVYTYHARSNAPISGTRSASKPELSLEHDPLPLRER